MIKSEDIFLVKTKDFKGNIRKHYYYCIYTQREDDNNSLAKDVIGLLITTNRKMESIIKEKNDYNVKVKLNTKNSYVCCDKIFRFSEDEIVDIKGDLLDDYEKKQILRFYTKFIKETLKQLGVNINGKRNNYPNGYTKSSI